MYFLQNKHKRFFCGSLKLFLFVTKWKVQPRLVVWRLHAGLECRISTLKLLFSFSHSQHLARYSEALVKLTLRFSLFTFRNPIISRLCVTIVTVNVGPIVGGIGALGASRSYQSSYPQWWNSHRMKAWDIYIFWNNGEGNLLDILHCKISQPLAGLEISGYQASFSYRLKRAYGKQVSNQGQRYHWIMTSVVKYRPMKNPYGLTITQTSRINLVRNPPPFQFHPSTSTVLR